MNRDEIAKALRDILVTKLIHTKFDGKTIEDVRVEINEHCDYYACFDALDIRIKVTTPKRKKSFWRKYYI